ncbi:hypothetical protein N7476_005050 [Penicillium atrosanguineum]|uniref:DNA polymerase zeta catalytic subunit n=1 Tax=Penicillium atrosanguineum TaxID=1132637 RepID=A0A9W9Q1W6_9EURO|nr:hypothetical protein N7476_005050 [Penicillium atrosanguineum]
MEPFRVRLNCIDHYQATPSELDPALPFRDGATEKDFRPKVPVIRVFGATETGQRVCVHVHGVFPYLYIEYSGSLTPEAVHSARHTLHLSIDHALAVSYRRNAYDRKTAYVAHITLVKGIPFYGYHVGYRPFFKIYLLNPSYAGRLADLLHQGAVMKRPLQPYEAHMQFVPQWVCDYNLYGCAYMDCKKVRFRSPVPDYVELANADHRWHDRSIPPEDILYDPALQKQSHCPLEVDACVQDILNRSDVKERPLHHDFGELLRPVAFNERLVPSVAGLWQDETRRRKKRMGIHDPGSTPFGPDELIDLAFQLAEEERRADGDTEFETFLNVKKEQDMVQTALNSVEDFYPDRLDKSKQSFRQDLDELAKNSVDGDLARSSQPDGQYLSAGKHSTEEDIHKKPRITEDHAIQESFYDGVFDDILQPDDEAIKGLLQEGFQKVPFDDELTSDPPVSRPNPSHESQIMDRNLDSSLKGSFTDLIPHDLPPGEKRRFWSNPDSSHIPLSNSRLNYPVVKDPNDPLTILRFSQDDGQSKTGNECSQHPPSSFPGGSATSPSGNGSGGAISSILRSSSTVVKSAALNPHVAKIKQNLCGSFNFPKNTTISLFRFAAPGTDEVASTILDNNRPSVVYQKAYFSDETDVPERPRQYAGREFRLESDTVHYLPEFDPSANLLATFGDQSPISFDREKQEKVDQELRESCIARMWEFAPVPPSRSEVVEWFKNLQASQKSTSSKPAIPNTKAKPEAMSQIEGPTQNPHGFKYSQKAKTTSVEHQAQYMSTMSLEVHVNTRGAFSANHEISCIFWGLHSEDEDIEINSHLPGVHVGMIYQGEGERPESKISKALRIDMEHEPTKLDMINRLVDIVRYHDPDILIGYEVHNGSWGYVIERARKKYDFDLTAELSRVKSQSHGKFGREEERWGADHTSSVQITGRHVINIWRAMRGELNLPGYTMENVVFHLLHRRIPHYSAKDLTKWYQSGKPRSVYRVVEYFTSRMQMNLELLKANELIPRTSEQARLLGIDFSSVYFRGSQFKVESLMFRIAKPENYLLVSPSRKQVGQQNALECLPLVMEPQSDFYTSPLVVLDFQSLYPSVMIAYNYCYSTFLGRASQWRGRDKMGFMDYKRQPRLLELLKNKINISPNGMMYAKQEVRQSLLAKMLTEILETRVIVKTGMKADKDDKILQRLLNNRQLALKLIANVTYGYTSASFSGRMPCSEIADSIVQSGRETLEKAIAFIHSVERWGAEVVYGDTDSLFEIAQAVTDMNPRPVKLKFEKIYHPCVLLAKKRYVGFKYEHRHQKEPDFDAKGIETVRRDGTPAAQKIEEKALKILFRTADLSQVKSYFHRQCSKIMQGRVSIQDFCFAREVRLGTYSDRGQLPAGAMISTKRMREDYRLEPQNGERCVAPEALLHDAQLDLDAEYYITKNLIPPLERSGTMKYPRSNGLGMLKKTLESYMRSSSCILCKAKLSDATVPVCSECLQTPHLALLDVVSRLQRAEKRVVGLEAVCRSCMGVPPGDDICCDSMGCPVYYSRTRDAAHWRHSRAVLKPVAELLEQKGDEGLDW